MEWSGMNEEPCMAKILAHGWRWQEGGVLEKALGAFSFPILLRRVWTRSTEGDVVSAGKKKSSMEFF